MYSLPMIAPRPDVNFWPSHRQIHTAFDDTASQSPPHNTTTSHQRRNSQHGAHQHNAHPSTLYLAALTNDENTIEQRKQNVRRFGAGWLRPPGVAKTLQAIKDEELEREEQEMMQRREQVMLDLAAAQQDTANEAAREDGEAMEGQEGEVDLDDDVPEAEEASDSDVSASDSNSDEEDGDEEQESTVPFNEDSFIEGSMLEAEVSHMLEMEEAEMAGVLQDERDLDDDVPEAGSYEHTDSELEDDSDANNSALPHFSSARSRRISRRTSGRLSSGRRSSGAPSGVVGGVPGFGAPRINLGVDLGHGRSSFGMDGSSSIMEGSSFLRSSPAGVAAATRGSLRDRFLGAARGGRRG
ncbi:hypothetical protein ACN47E_003224 [Coniothyrium glycines]